MGLWMVIVVLPLAQNNSMNIVDEIITWTIILYLFIILTKFYRISNNNFNLYRGLKYYLISQVKKSNSFKIINRCKITSKNNI